MNTRKKLSAKPAGYPKTSQSEQESADIFHRLLDRKSVRGSVIVMDKIPNTDEVLTMIDHEQIPIGYFDVQLKTLDKRYQKNPKFQCPLPLIAYALDALLPVFLVVIDQTNEKAYWLHLDEQLASSISPKLTAKSILLSLDTTQIIDRVDLSYVIIWKDIIKQLISKVKDFDRIENQRQAFKNLLSGSNPRLLPAFSINEFAIREIHLFLDLLNNNLDSEFKAIKEILYYNYWKLAIALIDYRSDGLEFFILPLPLSSNIPLILEIAEKRQPFMDDIFAKDKALIMMLNSQENLIRINPKKLALELLNNEVFKVIGKIDFAVDSIFLATEYLYSFACTFHSILQLSENPDAVDLESMDRIIFLLLPISREVEYGASHGEITHIIDHLKTKRTKEYVDKIIGAEKAFVDGVTANPKLKLSSRLYNLDLVKYYLDLMGSKNIRKINRTLLPMKDKSVNGSFVWDCWILPNIYENLQGIILEFPKIYAKIVNERFPLLKVELDLYQENSLYFC